MPPDNVLVTGAFGRVGTAIIAHLGSRSEYNFQYLDRQPSEEFDGITADITNRAALETAFEGIDAVVHLAGYPETDGSWPEILENNIIGMQRTLSAARKANVETFVFASSNHAVGMYEVEHAPELYDSGYELLVDHTVPHRPDSFYGTSKCFGEDLGRYYIENYESPSRLYALRIGSVRSPPYDHPYGDAERGVERGDWDRGSERYVREVRRMKATWQSRRDLAQMVDCCLRDDSVDFDVFYGVSDNDRRWFDLTHARSTIDYDPRDNGETWESPPE